MSTPLIDTLPASGEPPRLRPDLVQLRHEEPYAGGQGMQASAYALLAAGRSLLVDAPFADLVPALRWLGDSLGHPPAALVLTHRHVAAQADALERVARTFGLALFMHPLDARHPQGRAALPPGMRYQDPTASPLLAELGVEVIHWPGHTEGHVALYTPAEGGLLVCGDCAMGPSRAEAAEGVWNLVRPPLAFNVDDEEIRRLWVEWDRPLADVAQYHGEPFVGHRHVLPAALASLRAAPPTRGIGVRGAAPL